MIRVTQSEAHQQLLRLIAVFPRHGMDELGVIEYARTMAGFFAGEWHMRKVIDEAKRTFRHFPSLAELRDLCDTISAARPSFVGCSRCLKSVPGMAYVTALWTPGADGRQGKIEPISEESAESIRPQINAAIAHAKDRGLHYDGQRIIEQTDANAAVGYCTCAAGAELRQRRLAARAIEDEKRGARRRPA